MPQTAEVSLHAEASALLRQAVRSFERPYSHTWWLRPAHLATLYTSATSQMAAGARGVPMTRRLLSFPCGGQTALDFHPPLAKDEQLGSRPIVLAVHGAGGSSQHRYIVDMCKSIDRVNATIKDENKRWRCVTMLLRGCGGTELTTPFMPHPAWTSDIGHAVSYLREHSSPLASIFGAGFSLGGSMLASYCAEKGSETGLKAAAVVGVPWDFTAMDRWLEGTAIGWVYSRVIARKTRLLAEKHAPLWLGEGQAGEKQSPSLAARARKRHDASPAIIREDRPLLEPQDRPLLEPLFHTSAETPSNGTAALHLNSVAAKEQSSYPKVELIALRELIKKRWTGLVSLREVENFLCVPLLGESEGHTATSARSGVKSLSSSESSNVSTPSTDEKLEDYHRRVSAGPVVDRVTLPFLAICASDDPLCPASSAPVDVPERNKNVAVIMARYGGHTGFFESIGKGRERWRPRCWVSPRIMDAFMVLDR